MEPEMMDAKQAWGGYAGQPGIPAPHPGGVVTSQTSFLADAVAEAEKLVAMLEERLGAVLLLEPEQMGDPMPDYPSTGVALGDGLAELNGRLSRLNSRLGSIHRRIEL